MNTNPLISIIIPTYNRASLLERSLNSVINQTIKNIEIIIVDDGSTDNTNEVVNKYKDSRINYIKHTTNKGVCAAKNTGLKNVHGDWFTILDSDDEILSEALETMLLVPARIDKRINAVTCNCTDSITKKFSGKGFEHNQYLNNEIIFSKSTGEFWGITKTELLGNDRFNENVPGLEGLLWFKINNRATRYYIHKALRIYHTENADSIIKVNRTDIKRQYRVFKELLKEPEYLYAIKNFNAARYCKYCMKGFLVLFASRDNDYKLYKELMSELKCNIGYKFLMIISKIFGPSLIIFILRLKIK